MTTTSYLCIGCPLGCRLELDEDDHGGVLEVRGAGCRKGERYAVEEHTDPRRSLTTTVAVEGGRWPRLPVKSDGTVPKDLVVDACRSLATVRVTAPVRLGDVIVDDILGTGCAVIATRDLPAA